MVVRTLGATARDVGRKPQFKKTLSYTQPFWFIIPNGTEPYKLARGVDR